MRELERRIGVSSGFFLRLQHEDDWSFIIKAHAFLEAAVAEFVVAKLDERLAPIIRRAAINGRGGKMEFAAALGLTETYTQRFTKRLSTIRNDAAHDVRSVGMVLYDYLGALNPQELANTIADLTSPFSGLKLVLNEDRAEIFRHEAKNIIHLGLMATIAEMYFTTYGRYGAGAFGTGKFGDGTPESAPAGDGELRDALTYAFLATVGTILERNSQLRGERIARESAPPASRDELPSV